MEIQQKDHANNGLFFVSYDGKILAKMTYVWAEMDKTIIINHTEVDEKLRGKGVGKQLIAKAVEFARKNEIKIVPLCPFAKAIFNKASEYKDVL